MNDLRFTGTGPHIESWFVRANDPAAPRALWLKMTILAPVNGPPVAETWFVFFDGAAIDGSGAALGAPRSGEQHGVPLAHKDTVPIADASFDGGTIRVARCRFDLTNPGSLRGELDTKAGKVSYALELKASAPPLKLFPSDLMFSPLLPGGKTLTPFPVLELNGEVKLPSQTVKVEGWRGSQGHNWGKEHTFEYAWGQCVFPATATEPETMVEGYSARARAGGRITLPRMSALVVRRGVEELRFDRTFDFLRQEATVGPRRWTLRLRGPGGEARLRMDASDRPVVCLGYQNPDHHLSYCFNSKLANVLLEVRPKHGPEFRCKATHLGALELLRREPEAGMEVV